VAELTSREIQALLQRLGRHYAYVDTVWLSGSSALCLPDSPRRSPDIDDISFPGAGMLRKK
jgi:hypothetical protein